MEVFLERAWKIAPCSSGRSRCWVLAYGVEHSQAKAQGFKDVEVRTMPIVTAQRYLILVKLLLKLRFVKSGS